MSNIKDVVVPEGWERDCLNKFWIIKRWASPRPIEDPKWWWWKIWWVRISNITSSRKYLNKTTDYLSNAWVNKSVRIWKWEVILSICATIWKPIIVNTDVCIHDGFVWFYKLVKSINREYFYYFLLNKQDFLAWSKQTWTQGNINTWIVWELIFLKPSLKEQEKIAEILSTVDEAIEKTDSLIEKYKKTKTWLMEDLFTKWIDLETWKPHTKFKDSELGRIPESWEVEKLDNFIDFFTDFTANWSFESLNKNTKVLDEKDYAYYVRLYDIRLWVWHNKQKYVDKNTFNFLSKSYLKWWEVLLANIWANVWETFLFRWDWNLATLAPNMILMRLKKNVWEFFYYYSKSYLWRKEILKVISWSWQPKINKTDLKCVKISNPSFKEQEKIAEILTGVDDKIEKEEEYRGKLEKMKKGLMNDLLTGKVRVEY